MCAARLANLPQALGEAVLTFDEHARTAKGVQGRLCGSRFVAADQLGSEREQRFDEIAELSVRRSPSASCVASRRPRYRHRPVDLAAAVRAVVYFPAWNLPTVLLQLP